MQSAEPASEPIAPLVQYHVKGEFKPIDIIISSAEPTRPSETISQILPVLPTAEESLHQATEKGKEVEVHAPVVQVAVEKEPEKELEPQYASWDASKSVAAIVCN
jgi:hypothetical protein